MVLEIQRMSTEDGPGIRTTLFMKGCPLRCSWCHNPESIYPRPEAIWTGSRCIGCGRCIETCPSGSLSREATGIIIDRGTCSACGRCAEACPSGAMELLGTEWDAASLAEELVKDRAYFETSGGGITISGGESTLQPGFVAELLKTLKKQGIHTALDTCGYCSRQSLDLLLPYTDLLLFDIKTMDPVCHREFTGQSNDTILENLSYCCGFTHDHLFPREIWIRTPVIPDATDSDETVAAIGRFIASLKCARITRWELCSFNNLCADKYLRLGRKWHYAGTALVAADDMVRLAEAARSSGVAPSIVAWSGATRNEEISGNTGDPDTATIKGRCGC